MKNDINASIQRRMLFAGDSRLYWDRAANNRLAIRYLKSVAANHRPVQRVPDKLTALSYDFLESVRTGCIVPCFGEPRAATLLAEKRLLQHPNYRIYWDDTHRKVEIGIQLGVDLIKHQGRYYPIELNLDASLKEEQRQLYPAEEPDPILAGIALKAAQAGYKNLILFHRIWNDRQKREMQHLMKSLGIQITGESQTNGDPANSTILALPDQLREQTLCVVFHSQHQPIDFFVCDKSVTSIWLQQQNQSGKLLGTVRSSTSLFVPQLDQSEYWPNLVVKLGGIDWGKCVVVAKVRDENEAMCALGMIDRDDKPRILDSLLARFEARLFHRDHVVYQEFIPPQLMDSRYTSKIRSHFVFTPVRDFFLSAHFVVSDTKLPEEFPFGRVMNAKSLVVNRNQGGYYKRVDAQTEQDLEQIGVELGRAIRAAVSAKFATTPDEETELLQS